MRTQLQQLFCHLKCIRCMPLYSRYKVRKVAVREAKVLKQVDHPNIVKLMEVFRTKSNLYLVFEFVDFTLLDCIQRHRYGVPHVQLTKLLLQLAQAIDFLHQRKASAGHFERQQPCPEHVRCQSLVLDIASNTQCLDVVQIIHRDLKPENTLVTKDGQVKLADFGFARSVPQLEGQWTAYVSTRWYRAPEMLLGSEYGAAADIWAFGCILAEMATGEQRVVHRHLSNVLSLPLQTFPHAKATQANDACI